jgi:hypothetical protein
MSKLRLESHDAQTARWPRQGHHVLAQYDDDTVVVYQAYRRSIGRFAATHGWFGGGFSLSRMSWIKPNYLWMMYRCGWGTKVDQEVVLAIWLRRAAFDAIVAQAVPSAWDRERYADRDGWQEAVRTSDVRLQWDPDHGPSGAPLERRAVQLGLRGEVLARYAREWIAHLDDVSPLVAAGREQLRRGEPLVTPREDVYPLTDAGRAGLGIRP